MYLLCRLSEKVLSVHIINHSGMPHTKNMLSPVFTL